MTRRKITKIVGKINDNIIERYKLYDYREKDIIQSMDFYLHVAKHREQFKSIDSYNNTLINIDKIIGNPNFVYYEKNKNALLYFKKIDEDVCVVVRLQLRHNKDCYVATVYPISENKINRFKEKSYIDND